MRASLKSAWLLRLIVVLAVVLPLSPSQPGRADASTYLLALSADDKKLTFVDARDFSTTRVAPVVFGFRPSGGLAVVANRKLAFVASAECQCVWTVDLASLEAYPTRPQVIRTTRVGKAPVDLAASLDGRSVWVADALDPVLWRVDADSGQVTMGVQLGSPTVAVALSPEGDSLYAAHNERDIVSMVDLRTLTLVEIVVGRAPRAIEVNANTGLVYAAVTNGVAVLDPSQRLVVSTLAAAPFVQRPRFAPDWRRLFVPSKEATRASVVCLDVAVGTGCAAPLDRPLGGTGQQMSFPRDLAVGLDGSTLYILDDQGASGRILVFRLADPGAQVAAIDVGRGPVALAVYPNPRVAIRTSLPAVSFLLEGGNGGFNRPVGIAVAPDGSVYVADTGNHRIQRFDAQGRYLEQWGDRAEGVQFKSPQGVAVGPGGAVYVADSGNHRIVKLDPAGLTAPQTWASFPGGPALNGPVGIAVDSAQNLYVTDSGGRLFIYNEPFNLLAGTNASLQQPACIAVDRRNPASVVVYVADQGTNTVRAFDGLAAALTGVVWGQPGHLTGRTPGPRGVAVGPEGSVYVGYDDGPRVVRFAPTTGGYLYQWGRPGNNPGELNQPGCLAVATDGSVYVADTGNNRVQRFTSGGNWRARWGEVGIAGLDEPMALWVEPAPNGRVFVADTNNGRVQVASADGSTAAWSGLSYPAGIAGAGAGSSVAVYVAESSAHRLVAFDATGTPGTFPCPNSGFGTGLGQFNRPFGLAVSRDGATIYVADSGNHRVQRCANGAWTTFGRFGGLNGQFNSPSAVAVDPAGNLYVADSGNHRVQVFDANEAFVGSCGSAGSGDGQLLYPRGVSVDNNGILYVSDTANHRIVRFAITSPAQVPAPSLRCDFLSNWGFRGSEQGQFRFPSGLFATADFTAGGLVDVFVADTDNNRVQRFRSNGSFEQQWGDVPGTGNGQFNSPSGVAADAAGNLYVADTENDRIQKFDARGIWVRWESRGPGPSLFRSPASVAVGGDGRIYVADTGNHQIKVLTPGGILLAPTIGRPGPGIGQLSSPRGVAAAPVRVGTSITQTLVFVADTDNNRVQIFDATTGQSLAHWAAPGNAALDRPTSIAVDARDPTRPLVSVADSGRHRIVNCRLLADLQAGDCRFWGGLGSGDGQYNSPSGVAVGPDGSVYVADTGNQRIQKLTSSGQYVAQAGSFGRGPGQFNLPAGVAIGPKEVAFVADTANHRIQRFDFANDFVATDNFLGQWGFSWRFDQDPDLVSSTTLEVSDVFGGSFSWTVTATVTTTVGLAWLQVSPPAGPTAPTTLHVTASRCPAPACPADPAARTPASLLRPGTYQGTVILQAPGSNASRPLPVTLVVSSRPLQRTILPLLFRGSGAP